MNWHSRSRSSGWASSSAPRTGPGVVIYRLFNFWLPIIPALALMPAIRDLRERFHKAEQTAA